VEELEKKLNLSDLEDRILHYWKEEDIYSLIRKKEEGKEKWRFVDGPPYTTGSIHLGTAWNKILKDYFARQGSQETDASGCEAGGY